MRSLVLGLLLAAVSFPAAAQTVVLRDSIGPDDSWTSGLEFGSLSFRETSTGTVSLLTLALEPGASTTLTQFEAVVGSVVQPCGGRPCYGNMNFYIMAWGEEGDIELPLDAPSPGKLFQVDITDRFSISQGFGTFPDTPTDSVTDLVSFDLTGLNLQCPATGCIIAVYGEGFGLNDGVFEVRDSLDPGPFDTQRNDQGFVLQVARSGVRIIGAPVGSGTPVPALGLAGLLILGGGLLGAGSLTLRRR